MLEEILEMIENLKRTKEEHIRQKWWLFYNQEKIKRDTKKYIFCKQVYPVFTGLKFPLGEKQ